MGKMIRMLLIWVAIFSGLFVLFLFRAEFAVIWTKVKSEISPGGISAQDGSIILRKAEDGHFYVNALVNHHNVRFLIDSGATVTSLSPQSAEAAGVTVDRSGFPVIVDTANGNAEEWRARIAEFNIGTIERKDFPVHVGDGLGEINLLGMNFLNTLSSWRAEGDALIMKP